MENKINNVDTNLQIYKIQLSPLKKKLQDVKDITADNIEKVLIRGDKLEKLVNNTENLNNNSRTFNRTARRFRYKMIYKRARCYILSIILGSFIIYLFAFLICGKVNLKNCN